MQPRTVLEESKSSWQYVEQELVFYHFDFKYPVIGNPVELVGGERCQCNNNQKAGEDVKAEGGFIFLADSDFVLQFS